MVERQKLINVSVKTRCWFAFGGASTLLVGRQEERIQPVKSDSSINFMQG